jgi:hypothetical protein
VVDQIYLDDKIKEYIVDLVQATRENPGDRLDLPAGVRHSAIVGPQGVTCLEAHVY